MPDTPTVDRASQVTARIYGDAVTTLLTVAADHGCPLVSVSVETGVPGAAVDAPTLTCHVLPASAYAQAEEFLAALDPASESRHRRTPGGRCYHARITLGEVTIPVRVFVRKGTLR
jgi:hypothetical protein